MDDIENMYRLLNNQVPSSWIKPEMVDRNNAMQLSASGISDTIALAAQVYQRYANLPETHQQSAPAVRFISSEFQRSIDTANTFRSTIDPDNHTMPVSVIPLANDTILAMKHNCMRWNMAKDDAAADIQNEIAQFDSIYSAGIIRHVNKQLNSNLLSVDNIQSLYRMCGYDMSLFRQPSHWCSLFDYKTAALLELRGDLAYSRKYGPDGSQINSHLACALFSEIINGMDAALRNPDSAVSVFRFAHAETIMFASNMLGLDKTLGSHTKPVTGNMTYEEMLHRGFKTSTLVPFSSNLGLELYVDQTLAFSTPPTSAKIAVYLVTLAVSLISIGFSGWLVYRRLRKAINAQEPNEERYRGSVVSDNAEDTYQYNLAGPDDISAPPVPNQQQPMYFDNQEHMSMPLPPIPPAPPLTLDIMQVPAATHEHMSENKDHMENSSDYDDRAQVYAFETIKIHPEQSRSPQMPTAPGNNQNAASSIDNLVESMLENFGNQSSTNQAPSIPLPAIQPHVQPNAADIDSQRKADAKRKLLQEAMNESSDGEDFFDSDSDNMSSKGVSPGHSAEDGWRPTSVNYDSIAAHIAQALSKPSESGSHGALHVTNGIQSVDVSPRSVEYVMTPPAQSAVVYTLKE
ncbi:hypothetical protein EV183_004308 [Coemansia sp. RSA 2336]|nr:hypothetical protein EV183_004308 [Coemansia sp. RSA 2336]